ncbi:MAG: transposase [Nanoarchaeota archaeon]|nr:transposase [Nanoarchaeota archaeon]
MNRERTVSLIHSLRYFTNNSLGTKREIHTISGFELSEPLLDAAVYNTYVETVGNKADTLYLRLREGLSEMTTYSYLDYIKRLSDKFSWKNKEFVLAFDYTDEEFYGDVQGLDIHGWKKTGAITGKFKFLTCSIVSDDIPQKIPLLSLPIQLGHYKSYVISHMLTLIKPLLGEIKLLLFDRGFYDKDLMYELIQLKYPFLIFVPKHHDKKEILFPLEEGEKFTVLWNGEVNKDKSNYKFEFYLTFMKQIYSRRADTYFDWVFATNIDTIALEEMIRTYRKRWRIETGFRVQDEARIKCKSTEMRIRYFLFMFEQMLQTQWVCFYKEEVSFKEFLIEMHKTCKSLVENQKRSYFKNLKA